MASVLEFAKSTIAKALGPQGPALPFTIGEPELQQERDSIFAIHKGQRKDDPNVQISVFIFDIVRNPDKRELARNALKKARTIRHPQALKFIDGAETETQIIIGVEQVVPLSIKLQGNPNQNLLGWGLYKLAVIMKFLNTVRDFHY
jgi:SCY1-like protein 1